MKSVDEQETIRFAEDYTKNRQGKDKEQAGNKKSEIPPD